jgi:hypothetical protein
MLPWIKLDRAVVPGGGGELQLMQRGTEFSIMAGGNGLMNRRLSGFTLRAALASFPADSRIIVAELVPEIIAWARGPLAFLHGTSLDDPRVTLYEGDVGAAITDGKPYDAILLDVDNGPEGLSRPSNDRLYTASGISTAKLALAMGGHLAVWSSARDAPFTKRLNQSGMQTEEITVRANGKRGGARHTIWFATRR